MIFDKPSDTIAVTDSNARAKFADVIDLNRIAPSTFSEVKRDDGSIVYMVRWSVVTILPIFKEAVDALSAAAIASELRKEIAHSYRKLADNIDCNGDEEKGRQLALAQAKDCEILRAAKGEA